MATITAMPPRRPLTTSTTYTLAHTAQCKLKLAANRPDRNLRFVLGHAFTLDNLMLRIVEIENRSAKSMFEEVTTGGGDVHYDCTAGANKIKTKSKPEAATPAQAPEPEPIHNDGRGRRISFQDNNARPSSIGSGTVGVATNNKNTTSSPARRKSPPPVSAPARRYPEEDDDTSSDDYDDEPDTYEYEKATHPKTSKPPQNNHESAYSDEEEEDDPYDDDMGDGGGLMRFESASAQPPRMVRSSSSSSSGSDEDDGPVTPPQLPADVDLRELLSGEKDAELAGLYESVKGCACHGQREDREMVEGVWDVPMEKSPEGRRLAVVSVAA